MLFRRLKKPDPEAEQTLRDQIEAEGGLEKNDVRAMVISAFLVIFPVAVIVLALFVLIAWLLF